MKICISAKGFRPAGTGGTETYFRNLLEGLQAIDSINQYTVYVQKGNASSLDIGALNFKVVELPSEPIVFKIARRLRINLNWWERYLELRYYRDKFDLVHYPFHIIDQPAGNTLSVVTFMDMQQEYYPEFFSTEELKFRAETNKVSCQKATRVIAISEYTKQTLIERYKIPHSKISAIPIGYNEKLYSAKTTNRPKYLPNAPYFYYPAATWPHKNHPRLLEAFREVSDKYPRYRLVLSGVSMQDTEKVKNKISELKLGRKVKMLGYLPYEDLPAVFTNSYALVFPSLFEGFGIPVLEAMASDCPVLASNNTSIPEAGGDAAVYFDPKNSHSIAQAMSGIIKKPDTREKMIRKGRQQVKKFTTVNMAKATLAVYKELYENK